MRAIHTHCQVRDALNIAFSRYFRHDFARPNTHVGRQSYAAKNWPLTADNDSIILGMAPPIWLTDSAAAPFAAITILLKSRAQSGHECRATARA